MSPEEISAGIEAYGLIGDVLQGRPSRVRVGDGLAHLTALCDTLRQLAAADMVALLRAHHGWAEDEAIRYALGMIAVKVTDLGIAALDGGRMPAVAPLPNGEQPPPG